MLTIYRSGNGLDRIADRGIRPKPGGIRGEDGLECGHPRPVMPNVQKQTRQRPVLSSLSQTRDGRPGTSALAQASGPVRTDVASSVRRSTDWLLNQDRLHDRQPEPEHPQQAARKAMSRHA